MPPHLLLAVATRIHTDYTDLHPWSRDHALTGDICHVFASSVDFAALITYYLSLMSCRFGKLMNNLILR